MEHKKSARSASSSWPSTTTKQERRTWPRRPARTRRAEHSSPARPSSIRVESANAHTGIEIPLSGNLISAKYGCAIYVIRSP